MSQPPKTTRDLISEFMVGLACLLALIIVAAATFGAGWWTAWSNGQKVQEMTRLCISQGYDGWSDEGGDRYDGESRCFGNGEED